MRFSVTRPGKTVPRWCLDDARVRQWDALMAFARERAALENRRVRVAATIDRRGRWSYTVVAHEADPVTKSVDA